METGKYPRKADGDQEAPPGGAHLTRRRLLLVGAGGVTVAIATAVARGSGGGGRLATGKLDQALRPLARPTAPRTPASTAKPRPSGGRMPDERHVRTVSSVNGQPVRYLDDGPKVIALTIDDGPSPLYTPQVLQVLEQYNITASFSMIGENVSSYPAVAREVADAGHVLVNHTWNHANLTLLSEAGLSTEIGRATDVIHGATGVRPQLMRAPYGAWSPAVLRYCASEKLTPLGWSVDPRDWSRPGVSRIVATIMSTTQTGSIILEHDGGGDRSQTVAALKIVIPRLLDEGYRFEPP